jgi:acetylornithine/N-succinyldiaminopimelate aminotransferase
MNTIETEEKYFIPFFNKIPISIERGRGIYVWDEDNNRYIDFTSGWGVTCLGHAHPVITEAIREQSDKIIQNPSSGLTYSPARARLLASLADILPGKLSRVFFSNSGAEANDAAIKIARKVSGRTDVIATNKSFHGRTISTASATGQAKHREKFNPLMPSYRFVPYNNIEVLEKEMDQNVAAIILEPIQGEGGINLASAEYLKQVSDLCDKNGSFLIIDEIQTGFCRTGPMFAIDGLDINVDFLTMAKGIGGGFPIGAFAISERIADKIEKGDHGGTYCGNPLGCAVAHAVVEYLKENDISKQVTETGEWTMERLNGLQKRFPEIIQEVRGRGLLIALQIFNSNIAAKIYQESLNQKLFLNLTQERIIRIFPALNISRPEMDEGLKVLEQVLTGLRA